MLVPRQDKSVAVRQQVLGHTVVSMFQVGAERRERRRLLYENNRNPTEPCSTLASRACAFHAPAKAVVTFLSTSSDGRASPWSAAAPAGVKGEGD